MKKYFTILCFLVILIFALFSFASSEIAIPEGVNSMDGYLVLAGVSTFE